MRALHPSLPPQYLRKVCLSCGYDGPAIQCGHLQGAQCPQCFENLQNRPPRSYAELEGLDEELEFGVIPDSFLSRASLLSRFVTMLQRWRRHR